MQKNQATITVVVAVAIVAALIGYFGYTSAMADNAKAFAFAVVSDFKPGEASSFPELESYKCESSNAYGSSKVEIRLGGDRLIEYKYRGYGVGGSGSHGYFHLRLLKDGDAVATAILDELQDQKKSVDVTKRIGRWQVEISRDPKTFDLSITVTH